MRRPGRGTPPNTTSPFSLTWALPTHSTSYQHLQTTPACFHHSSLLSGSRLTAHLCRPVPHLPNASNGSDINIYNFHFDSGAAYVVLVDIICPTRETTYPFLCDIAHYGYANDNSCGFCTNGRSLCHKLGNCSIKEELIPSERKVFRHNVADLIQTL